jgi:hypothetical protein
VLLNEKGYYSRLYGNLVKMLHQKGVQPIVYDIGQCLGEPSIHQQSNKHALDYEGHSCKQRQKSPTYAPFLIPEANKINFYNHRSTFLIYLFFFSSHPILQICGGWLEFRLILPDVKLRLELIHLWVWLN